MPNPRLTASPSRSSHRRAAGDHLLGAPLGELERGARRAVVAGSLRKQLGLRRLELIGGDDDRVDHDARHADGLRRQRPALGEPLDLGDDEAAVVVGSERLVEHAERRPLVLAREVPVLVGGRGADDRHVNGDGPQVEPLAAVELDHRHDVLGRPVVHAAAVAARVHERVHAHLGQDARLADRRGPVELEQDPRRDVVGLDRVRLDRGDDLRRRGRRRAARVGAGDDAADLPGRRQVVDAVDAVHVAGGDRVEEGQVAALAARRVALAEGPQDSVGAAEPARRADRHGRPRRDAPDGLGRRQDRHEAAHREAAPERGIHHDVRGPRCIWTDFSSVKASTLNRPNSRPMPLSL